MREVRAVSFDLDGTLRDGGGAADALRRTAEQLAALSGVAYERRFDVIVISGEVGVAKPDPEAFRLVCAQLGIDPAATWHVGDDLTTDVGGAKASGLVAVWVDRDRIGLASNAVEPDLTIGSLDELVAPLASNDTTVMGPTE